MDISKEQLELDYIIERLSEAQIAKKYNTSRYFIDKLLKEYNIPKNIDLNDNKSHDKLSTLTRDMFYELYCVQNKSFDDIAALYGCSARQIKRLNSKYKCYKTKEQKNSNIQKSMKAFAETADYTESNNKRKETVKSKYNVDNVSQLDSVKSQIRKTNISKYGYSVSTKNDDVRKKISEALKQKFGDKFDRTSELIELINDPELFKNYILSLDEEFRDIYSLSELTGYSASYLTAKVNEYKLSYIVKHLTNTSHYETEIVDYLLSIGISKDDILLNNRQIVPGFEIDIYIKNKNLGIEFNGDYWHSDKKVSKTYHYEKSKAAEDLGIRIIHIYEYQWNNETHRNILKSIIRNAVGLNENKIYARQCEIRELKKKDVEEFSYKNSLHGHRSAKVYIGLFYNNELVELMSFGHPFFAKNKEIDYECIRSITKINYTVVGGMNKLFQYFVKHYDPKNVLYYVDYNTHIGNSMEKLGFKFQSYSKYGMVNIAKRKEVAEEFGYVFNRSPVNNKRIKQLISEGKVITIYQAGVKKYMWSK